MNTKIYIVVGLVAVLVVGVGAWLMLTPAEPQAVTPPPPPSPVAIPAQDTTAAITKDLNAVDLGNIDEEFKEIDADLNAL